MRILVLLLLVSGACWGQKKSYTYIDYPYPVDSTTNKVSYVGVVQVPNATADQLYTRAKSYIFNAFRKASSVIQADDKSGGLLGVKGIITVDVKPGALISRAVDLRVPLELRFKDGRFRYEITNLMSVFPPPIGEVEFDGTAGNAIRNTKEGKRVTDSQMEFASRIDGTIKAFVDDLVKAIKQPSSKDDF